MALAAAERRVDGDTGTHAQFGDAAADGDWRAPSSRPCASGVRKYCRDENGDNSSCLIGKDAWFFRILVRPVTAEVAADILAAE
jgi:hypothetical protein